jgi:glutaredoxin 3
MYTLYTKDGCSYCTMAKNLLTEEGKQFTTVNNPPQEIVDKLKHDTGHKTYPFIYHGKKFIGGFTDLQALLKPYDEDF